MISTSTNYKTRPKKFLDILRFKLLTILAGDMVVMINAHISQTSPFADYRFLTQHFDHIYCNNCVIKERVTIQHRRNTDD